MSRSKYSYKCKYCGKESGNGTYCRNCADRLPTVKQLMLIFKQMQEVKKERDERNRSKK